jgi:hypothetical protein
MPAREAVGMVFIDSFADDKPIPTTLPFPRKRESREPQVPALRHAVWGALGRGDMPVPGGRQRQCLAVPSRTRVPAAWRGGRTEGK